MLSIQDVGLEIMENRPRHLYAMCGTEYGIKCDYIDMLSNNIGSIIPSDSVESVLSIFERKQLFTPKSAVYVVRYDMSFVEKMDAKLANRVVTANINGVIVCIYDDSKSMSKLDKYIPDNVVEIPNVANKYIQKYIRRDFPKLPDYLVDIASMCSTGYINAKNIARCMDSVPHEILCKMGKENLQFLFGLSDTVDDNSIKIAVASKNFNVLESLLDKYEGDHTDFFYAMLSTFIELEKVKTSKYTESIVKDYAKYWDLEDIYTMFDNTYEKLKQTRKLSVEVDLVIIELFAAMKYSKVPKIGDM